MKPLRQVWYDMIRRCENVNREDHINYGGRGITVCDEWHDFSVFQDWAQKFGYISGLQIDRIDNDGPYCPENCHWVTRSENNRNKRSNLLITAFGETKTLIEWLHDDRCVVSYLRVWKRITEYGWNSEKALTEPARQYRRNNVSISR